VYNRDDGLYSSPLSKNARWLLHDGQIKKNKHSTYLLTKSQPSGKAIDE